MFPDGVRNEITPDARAPTGRAHASNVRATASSARWRRRGKSPINHEQPSGSSGTIPYASDNYLIADACLNGPDLTTNERAVFSMLATVRLAR